MTIKNFQIFAISTLICYCLLIILVSEMGIIHYSEYKRINEEEQTINLALEAEIESLVIEKKQLQEGNQVLDLAYELGYVNKGDKILHLEETKDKNIHKSLKPSIAELKPNSKSIFSGWKKIHFFLLSIPIGIAFTIAYLLLSKKMEKHNV